MVVGVPCDGGDMVVVGAERACCEVDASTGAFGCAATPDRIISCAGDESDASFG